PPLQERRGPWGLEAGEARVGDGAGVETHPRRALVVRQRPGGHRKPAGGHRLSGFGHAATLRYAAGGGNRRVPYMRFLVSNDDGVEAPGLRALAESLAALGEVTVCAPDREQSATSRSISLHRPLRIEQLPPWNGEIERWAVDGTPTDAVYVGLNHVLKERRPDVVASGINRGPNLANDVHYSGTVAAAMQRAAGRL